MFGFTASTYTVAENAGPAQGAVTITNDVILTFPINVTVNDIAGGTATGIIILSCVSYCTA